MMMRRLIGLIGLLVMLVACSTEAEPFFPTPLPSPTLAPQPTLLPFTLTPVSPTADIPTSLPITAISVADSGLSPGTDATTVAAYAFLDATQPPPNGPSGLDIEYFTTDAQSASAGGTLTLYWSVAGTDHGVIYRLTPSGGHDQFWQVGQSGTLVVTVSKQATDQARYELQISNAVTHTEKVVSVPIGCPQTQANWFFSPAPPTCPAGTAAISPSAQQGFEHGQMIWVGLTGQITILFDDGKQPGWAVVPDQYKDGMPDHDPSISPPAGKMQPVRGFGLVWRTQPGVRARLGWALSTEGQYDGFSQSDNQSAPKNTTYILTRDHQVAELNGDHTWNLIAVTLASPIATPKH